MKSLDQLAKSAKPTLRDENAVGRLQSRKQELFPLEVAALEHINNELRRVIQGSPELDTKFPRIDLEAALKSRKLQFGIPFPVPRFAAMNVKSKSLDISATRSQWNKDSNTDFPKEFDAYRDLSELMSKSIARRAFLLEALIRVPWMAAILGLCVLAKWLAGLLHHNAQGDDIIQFFGMMGSGIGAIMLSIWLAARMGKAYVRNIRYEISIEMGGALPDDARKAIKDNVSSFEAIYVVAEAPRWKFTRNWQWAKPEPKRVEADPLIVGRLNGCYYLIHTFDLTPLEKWLRAEFSGA